MEEHLQKLEEEESLSSSAIALTWNSSHEELLASIADRANCLRWMHNKCMTLFEQWNFWLTVPSIVINTLTGATTMGMSSLFPPEQQMHASTVLGLFGISCGILVTVNQYMKSPQFAEAHRISGIAYGKLHRLISGELALRRDQRLNANDFLKVIRLEQDRLQEFCPTIMEMVVQKFKREFHDRANLEKPEIAGDLDHVVINRGTKASEYHADTPLLKPSSFYQGKEIVRVSANDQNKPKNDDSALSTAG